MEEQLQTAPKSKSSLTGIGLAILLAVVTFLAGHQIGTSTTAVAGSADTGASDLQAGLFSLFSPPPEPAEGANLDDFWRVWDILDEKFVAATTTDALTIEERLEGAIAGLVASYGDPYTVFLPPKDAEQFDEDISGNFGGVGMEVGLRNGAVVVIAPLPDTPAERAGIVAADVIVQIDGKSTDGMNIDEAVRLIRGERGTEVVLTIFREGEIELLEVPIVRDTITIPTIDTEERDGVFIVSLYNFNAISEQQLVAALEDFVRSDAEHLVLDLRGNPGGFLQSAVAMSGYFLPAGKVVVRENFGDGEKEEVYRSPNKNLRQFLPAEIVVLVDEGSASASEILAGALREHGVATLIGEQTFGKGSVQELVDLPDGSSLKVTVARWLTPNGTSISDGGLEPDILVERTPQQVVDEEDPQLEAAIKYFTGGLEEMLAETASTTESGLGIE